MNKDNENVKKDLGIYVHIPFCVHKCHYCDFISFAGKENRVEEYIKCLLQEIENTNLDKYSIKTIYFGGGTPSVIKSKYISEILEKIRSNISDNAEITIEVNPRTVNQEKMQDYKKMGINRISIGLQSANDELLKEIGRIHNYKEFLEVYNIARKIGFKNINVDLMLGLPNQTLQMLEESVNKVIELNPEHISLYSLILEEGTKLYNDVKMGKISMPSEELERKMYWKTKRMLEKMGYIHYEISNFAKEGYKSKHNNDCWEQKEYIGFGVSAHSYLELKRTSNTENLENYIQNINSKEFSKNVTINEIQEKEDTAKEYMLLSLRKIEGVSITKYKNKFKQDPICEYNKKLDKLTKQGLIKIEKDNIRLTDIGLDLANLVWQEFV